LFKQRRLISGEREERAKGGVLGERANYGGERYSWKWWRLKAFHNEYGGRMNIGNHGFNLLTQLTEITTSLFIFDKQWHTCL